jgi:hypothetical protein
MRQFRKRVEVLVQRGVKARSLRAEDAGHFPWFILGAMKALLIRQMKGESSEPEAASRAALVRFVLAGAGAAR